jgi:RNase P subunit RPR2
MAKRRVTVNSIRNLPQYRDKSDEELKEIVEEINSDNEPLTVKSVIEDFKKDYDLDNMTANDRLTLNELARAFVTLKKLEEDLEEAREESLWGNFGKINREIHRLRSDLSSLQDDLNITRKSRQDSGQETVVDFIENLKKRGKAFLDKRLTEIYCPQCHMLLAKTWFLYPDSYKIELNCERCQKMFVVSEEDIVNNKNLEDVGPPMK